MTTVNSRDAVASSSAGRDSRPFDEAFFDEPFPHGKATIHQSPQTGGNTFNAHKQIGYVVNNYHGTTNVYNNDGPSTHCLKIRRWLSAPDPRTNYHKAINQRHDNTGLWFLESNQYAEWKTDPQSFVWLYGIPGCGKTILSSTILQNVFQHCNGDPEMVVAYFFFDFNDVQKRKPELMVRSLICQLLQQCVQIPKSLDTLFSSHENGQQQPSLPELLEVLQQMMRVIPHVYIILDALDECSDRKELEEILKTMSAWQLQNSHTLLTSRRERDMEVSLKVPQQNILCLQSELVDRDIEKYVQHMLSEDSRLRKWEKYPSLRQEIEAALMKGAQGM